MSADTGEGGWPMQHADEHADDYVDRCSALLASYQDSLCSAHLKVVFAPPWGRISPTYKMPSALNGGAVGSAWVFSDASEVEDLVEVSDRFAEEARIPVGHSHTTCRDLRCAAWPR